MNSSNTFGVTYNSLVFFPFPQIAHLTSHCVNTGKFAGFMVISLALLSRNNKPRMPYKTQTCLINAITIGLKVKQWKPAVYY